MLKIGIQKAKQLFNEGRNIYIAPKGSSEYALRLTKNHLEPDLDLAVKTFLINNPQCTLKNLEFFVPKTEVHIRYTGLFWLVKDVRSGNLIHKGKLTSENSLVKYVNSRILSVLNKGYLMPRFRSSLKY
ncbi:MAG: hypothetical protein ACFCUU_06015 [Cyclobacteriaceae bacterium]